MGRNTKQVDYALLIDGNPRVFVETKRQDKSLTDADRRQLKSYIRQERVTWGLLTNGHQFELYKYKVHASSPTDDDILVTSFELEELPDEVETLSVLSFESLSSGRSQEISTALETVQQAKDTLNTSEDRVQENIKFALERVLGDLPEDVKKTVTETTLHTLRDELDKHYTELTAESTVEGSSKSTSIEVKSLEDIGLHPSDKVRLQPGKDGIEGFLKPYKAWASRIQSDPREAALAIYSTEHQEIRYIGVIDRVIPLQEFSEDVDRDFSHENWYTDTKKAILFEEVYQIPTGLPLAKEGREEYDGDKAGSFILGSSVSFRELRTCEDVIEMMESEQ